MAPRRGGGGGYSSGSISDSCPYGFRDTLSQSLIAFCALYWLVFLVFFFVTGRRARKVKTGGLAKWLTYMSLTFAFVYMVLQIVFSTLGQCGHVSNHDYVSGIIASNWMSWLMGYCLLVLILAPICQRLHNKSPPIKIVTIICLALLGVLLIVYLSLYTRGVVGEFNDGYGAQYKYISHMIRIATAYFAIELIAMILAAGLILSAMSRAAHLRAKPIFISLVALVVSALGLGATNLAFHLQNSYFRGPFVTASDTSSYLALQFLVYFFYSCALLSAIYVWSSDQLDGARFSVPPPPHPPQYPGDMRGV